MNFNIKDAAGGAAATGAVALCTAARQGGNYSRLGCSAAGCSVSLRHCSPTWVFRSLPEPCTAAAETVQTAHDIMIKQFVSRSRLESSTLLLHQWLLAREWVCWSCLQAALYCSQLDQQQQPAVMQQD